MKGLIIISIPYTFRDGKLHEIHHLIMIEILRISVRSFRGR